MAKKPLSLDTKLKDVLRAYRDSFSTKTYSEENDDPDPIMDVFGITPDRKREIAYNAYRAVDDDAERVVIASVEAAARREGGTPEALYAAFVKQREVPETLAEEFELFRVLHQAARCYDLNTILATDPAVAGLKEAVAQTMELIGYAIASRGGDIRLTLDDYRDAVGAARAAT